ncbi:MAG: N-6 DNA methylase [Anaerolineae bacterium]|nr:N-6 DNA methylase [Anaerolineae bacterium]
MLPFADERTSRQRDRHFCRREKVLGQFFTPPQLAAWMVEIALPWIPCRESMLDPACGEGVFLKPARAYGFSEVVGVEVDHEVFAECARQLGGDSGVSLRHANALELLPELERRFDLVATNPPFSAKYGRVKESRRLERFALGAERRSEAMEVLFLELSVRALREDGALAIVLPEGLFANLPYRRVRDWLIRHVTPVAIISLSRQFFPAKSCILLARKGAASPSAPVLLAHVEEEADLAQVFRQLKEGEGVRKPIGELLEDMAPLHHLRPPVLRSVFPLRPLKELLKEMRGGHAEYGARRKFAASGIPFLSAKTVTPFGIDLRRDGRRIAPGSPMDHPGARARTGDVLFVRVGVGCIGRAAVVLGEDEEGIADDYIYILRLDSSRMLPEFFAWLTQTALFRQQLERIWRGTGTVTVPQRLLREVLVPVPPLSVQEVFADAYRRLHRQHREGSALAEDLAFWIDRLQHLLERGDNEAGEVHCRKMGCEPSEDRLRAASDSADRESAGEAKGPADRYSSGSFASG